MSEKELGRLGFEIDTNIDTIHQEVKTLKDNVARQGKQIESAISGSFEKSRSSVANSVAGMRQSIISSFGGIQTIIGGSIAGGLAFAVREFASFEKELSNSRAVLGLFGEEGKKAFEPVKQLAAQLGAETKFSATQAAEGVTVLGQAGFSTSEIMKSLSGVLDLAAANNIGIAESADIASSILRQFGIDTAETGRVMDVLSQTSVDSNANIRDLSDSFNYFGPTAKTLGISLEEASASIGILADNGIKGSAATRGLATGLSSLASPTAKQADVMKQLGINVFDANGQFVGMAKLFEELNKKTADFSQEQRIGAIATLFGNEARDEAIILLDNYAKIQERTIKNYQAQGVTEKIATEQQNNLAGAYERLTGAVSGTATSFGEKLEPSITKIVEGITFMVENFKSFVAILSLVGVSVGTYIGVNALLASGLTITSVATGIATAATTAWGVAIGVATGGIVPLIGLLSVLSAGYFANIVGIGTMVRSLFDMKNASDLSKESLSDLTKTMDENQTSLSNAQENYRGNREEVQKLYEEQQKLREALSLGKYTTDELTDAYTQNILKLQQLDKSLKEGGISTQEYDKKTDDLQARQEILKKKLGDVNVAMINNTRASDAYNKATVDTTVSVQQLEILRQKAIKTAEDVLKALILQQKTDQALERSNRSSTKEREKFVDTLIPSDIEKRIQDTKKELERLRKENTSEIVANRKQASPSFSLGGSGGGGKGGGKSEADKRAKEEAKAQEELDKLRQKEQENIEKLGKKRQDEIAKRKEELIKLKDKEIELRQEVLEKTKNFAKKQYDEVNKEIEKSIGKIDDFNKKIADLQKEIATLESDTSQSVADRAIEIEQTLASDQQLTADEINKLQQELTLARANTSEQDLSLARTKATESPTERLLREAEARKKDIEIQIAEQEQLKQAEILKKEELTARKVAIETDYTTKYGEQVADREETEIQSINRIEQARIESIERQKAKLLELQSLMTGRSVDTIQQMQSNPPGRFAGGQVRPNLDYLVGEKGPEIFRAASSGRIAPATETQKIVNQNFNVGGVNMRGYDTASEFLADLEWRISGIKLPR